MNQNRILTEEMLERFRAAAAADRMVQVAHGAASKTELADVAFLPLEAAKLEGPFSLELKTHGCTNQKQSGRCWMFAATNMMREIVIERCKLDGFELSNNYLAFFDKLEKCNNFLDSVIENADLPLNHRRMEYILHGIWDGGYWNMATDLVKKYGIVPASVMPDTYQSCHTAKFMRLLNTMLHKDAVELRALAAAGKDTAARKEEMLAEIYKAECVVFGEPVQTFDFEYRDKDEVFHADRGLTPKTFFEKYIAMGLDDYVTVTNLPTERKPLNSKLTFHYIGNMVESGETYLNLSMDEVKELVLTQLKDGEPVWFGCDSNQFGDRLLGIWDQNSFDFGEFLGGVDLLNSMTKGQRLDYDESSAVHAMLLVGVNFDGNGRPNRWKIENSWGDENGKKGYFVCSDDWFNEFVYETIINKKHLNARQLEILAGEAIAIEPWEG